MKRRFVSTGKMAVATGFGVSLLAVFAYGTWRNPNFWLTAEQRGDRLMVAKQFRQAESTYADPWRIGMAQYRNGDFEAAAHTFARVPGAVGAFDQGNAWLMHGKYDTAIESYDRALGFKPGWMEAEDNKALAQARKQRIEEAGEDRDEESADAYDADETVVEQKGDDEQSKPQDMNGEALSDAELRATWLRRVQTTPGDFLRAKFAYQAEHADQEQPPEAESDTR